MKLLTHNLLQCPLSGTYPLKIVPAQVERLETEFRQEVMVNMLPKLEWSVLLEAAADVRLPRRSPWPAAPSAQRPARWQRAGLTQRRLRRWASRACRRARRRTRRRTWSSCSCCTPASSTPTSSTASSSRRPAEDIPSPTPSQTCCSRMCASPLRSALPSLGPEARDDHLLIGRVLSAAALLPSRAADVMSHSDLADALMTTRAPEPPQPRRQKGLNRLLSTSGRGRGRGGETRERG